MTRRRLSTRRSRIVAGVLIVAVVWLGAACWLLWSAQTAMHAGRDDLVRARAGMNGTNLLSADRAADAALGDAVDQFAVADRRLSSPVLLPLRVLPVIGRHVDAAEKVNRSAYEGATIAGDALRDARTLAEDPPKDGASRVALLEQVTDLVARTRTRLEQLDPGTADALVGPLADAVVEVDEERSEAVESLGRAEAVTGALTDMLKGPDTYLLLGANNAEMRSGSGMFLTAAPLTFRDGTMSLGDVRPTSEIANAPKAAVSGDLASNWSWLNIGSDLRQLAMTPNFPPNADVASRFWETAPGGGKVAGVIVLDIDGLRLLLDVVGPVTVDGVTYDSENVKAELLRKQYERAGDDAEGTEDRHDQIGDVARAAFDRIESGDWKVPDMADALVEMVQQRHLLLWSADEASQRAWVDAGVSGSLRPETVAVTLDSRGANKLDPYLATTAEVKTTGGSKPTISITYKITSTAPTTGPRYQVGPNIGGMTAGQARALVVVNLPQGSSNVTLDGAERILDGRDGPTVLVAGALDIAPGATATVTITGDLPPGIDHLVLEPAARLPATSWIVDGTTYQVDRRRSVPVGTP